MSEAYWTCVIGPADRDTLREGADEPMRKAALEAFARMVGADPELCSTGWGVTDADAVERFLAAAPEDQVTYPHASGDVTVLGPECFTDGTVICWKGENYVRQVTEA